MIYPGSERWAQAYEAVISGRPYKELAPNLGITENTLKNYCHQVLNGLGCNTRAELQGRIITEATNNTKRWVGYSG